MPLAFQRLPAGVFSGAQEADRDCAVAAIDPVGPIGELGTGTTAMSPDQSSPAGPIGGSLGVVGGSSSIIESAGAAASTRDGRGVPGALSDAAGAKMGSSVAAAAAPPP